MEDTQPENEFRIKSGAQILSYIKQFSATEKVLFGFFSILLIISALFLLFRLNDNFMVNIPVQGGELREGLIGLPRTINPVLAVTDLDKDIIGLVYSGLMKYEDNKLIPDIAESMKVSDDGLTYDFILKDDLYFQDGIKLTSDDIAFTIQKIQDSNLKSPRRSDWLNVSTKIISAKEIQFILKQPYSPFLSNTTIGIIPKHIWSTISDEKFIFSDYNIKPIGSGPYQISTIDRDSSGIPSSYHLSTWSKYSSKLPYISKITLNFYTDNTKAIEALNSRQIDSLASISPDEALVLSKSSSDNFDTKSIPFSRTFGIFLNQNQVPSLSDLSVRQALDLSIDRGNIISKVLNNYGIPLYGPIPFDTSPNTYKSNSLVSTTSNNLPENILLARSILEKNGWKLNSSGIYEKKGTKNTVQSLSMNIYTANADDLKKVAEIIKTSWNTLGANVNIKVFEPSDLFQNVIKSRKYDVLLFGESIGRDRDFYAFWHSSQRNSPGLNVSMYVNSKVDKILEDLRTINDNSARDNKYKEFDNIIRQDLPEIFLYTPNYIYIINKNIKNTNIEPITTSSDRWASISKWYIKTEKVWKIFKN